MLAHLWLRLLLTQRPCLPLGAGGQGLRRALRAGRPPGLGHHGPHVGGAERLGEGAAAGQPGVGGDRVRLRLGFGWGWVGAAGPAAVWRRFGGRAVASSAKRIAPIACAWAPTPPACSKVDSAELAAEVERLKQGDQLSQAVAEFAKVGRAGGRASGRLAARPLSCSGCASGGRAGCARQIFGPGLCLESSTGECIPGRMHPPEESSGSVQGSGLPCRAPPAVGVPASPRMRPAALGRPLTCPCVRVPAGLPGGGGPPDPRAGPVHGVCAKKAGQLRRPSGGHCGGGPPQGHPVSQGLTTGPVAGWLAGSRGGSGWRRGAAAHARLRFVWRSSRPPPPCLQGALGG